MSQNNEEIQNTLTDLQVKYDKLERKYHYIMNLVNTNTDRNIDLKDRFFSSQGNGFILDNNFDFDAGLKVSGDFIDDEKEQYAHMIACALNNYSEMKKNNDKMLTAIKEIQSFIFNNSTNLPIEIIDKIKNY